MKFFFQCGPGGFIIDAVSVFDKRVIRLAMEKATWHWAHCPYCTFQLLPAMPFDQQRHVHSGKDVG